MNELLTMHVNYFTNGPPLKDGCGGPQLSGGTPRPSPCFEQFQNVPVELQKPAMLTRSPAAVMVVIDALKPPTIDRPILIDRATIVFAQELTAAVDIRQSLFYHATAGILNHYIGGKGPKASVFRLLQQHGIVMAILPTAVGAVALATGAFANDGNAEGPQERSSRPLSRMGMMIAPTRSIASGPSGAGQR
jgi:hypothetical protein